jgi:hypothetical protein
MDRRQLDAPIEAIEDREAQDHELADIETGGEPQPGRYPADNIENREGDITPDAPHPRVDWDTRVQPERVDERTHDGAMASPAIEKEGDK